nr:immunoglobulin heavy chain junction region [Macaca mulatta]MOW23247.1 immunoglobulin heavy chain junction region [Macaca mulatta]MOW23264.1 immunoglobulin heavy chain junction region [Macaca mulatta]MOW23428.1 immunoglobulin heavy chain junction region [Macaca mulatta]MOW23478.1 immunoglobulin heavy chain junction region [Macaca mulatta]
CVRHSVGDYYNFWSGYYEHGDRFDVW